MRQVVELIEAAVRNDVLDVLLRRFEAELPALFRVLAPALPDAIPAPASSAPGDSPAGSRPPVACPEAMPARVHPDAELRLAKVLAALKLGHPKTPAARELLDGAKMIVLSDMAALRAARSLVGARLFQSDMSCEHASGQQSESERMAAPESRLPLAPDCRAPAAMTFLIDDAGSGQ